MKTKSIQKYSAYNQNFGHTFKVNICIKKPTGEYDFVSPAKNTVLYKTLNSKIIGWLNEDFISNLRKIAKQPRKNNKKITDQEMWIKKRFVRSLGNIDSDYKEFSTARSVYDRFGLGYIATGIDVPILENLKGAKLIGMAKSDSLIDYGTTKTPYVRDIVEKYQHDAKKYVKEPFNLLRSKNDKEIMLKLNFRPFKNGKKDDYLLDNFEFYEIQKSKPLSQKQKSNRLQKADLFDEITNTILNKIKQITKNKKTQNNITTDTFSFTKNQPKKRKKAPKNDPRQLSIKFNY